MNIKEKILFVSTKGNDTWNGSKEMPFQTIEKARDEIRDVIGENRHINIIVFIMGGEYYLKDTLNLSSKDSVEDGFRVIYRNYDSKEVVINGGEKLSNWNYYKDGIYSAQVGANWSFNTLFENGRFCTNSRYPKENYNTVTSMIDNSPKDQFGFIDGDIPMIKDSSSLQTFIWPGGTSGEWNWFTNTIGIKEIDYENKVIKLENEACYELGVGSRYYIKNALELVSDPGEFYLDKNKGILYYKPFSMPIEKQNIVAPRVITLLSFKGDSEFELVKNISFVGLTLRNTDTASEIIKVLSTDEAAQFGGIYMSNSSNLEIKNCKIHNMGFHGFFMEGFNQDNSIYGNYIYDIGHTGIQIQGYYYSTKHVSKKNNIISNYINNMGMLIGHGAGIQILQSGENYIAYNKIEKTPRYAISLKLWPVSLIIDEIKVIEGIEITRENARKFSFTKDNIIEFNDLSRANYDSQDTGVIESWGGGTGNIIRSNRIHNSYMSFSFGFGIYLDDEADGFTVENNIIHDMQKSGEGKLGSVIFSKGVDNKFINNVIANNNLSGCYIGTFAMGPGWNKDLVSEKNIFYGDSGDYYDFVNWQEDRFTASDYNLIYNRNEVYNVVGVKEASNLEEWKRILNYKYEQHSILNNPLFMDETNYDYRLRYDSPAYKLRIVDIDYKAIGLKEDYIFNNDQEDISEIFIKSNINEFGSFLELSTSGKMDATLSIAARTVSGFLLEDLCKYEIKIYSSDDDIACVNKDGVVKAVGEGVTKVTVDVYIGEKIKSKSIHVLVNDKIENIQVNVPRNVLKTGDSMGLEVYGTTKYGRDINLTQQCEFIVDNVAMAEINNKAIIRTKTAGIVKINISAKTNLQMIVKPIYIKVADNILEKISLSHNSKILKVGEKVKYTVVGFMSDGSRLEIPSDNVEITSKMSNIISICGRDEIEVRSKGVCSLEVNVEYEGIRFVNNMYIRAIENTGELKHWDIKNYGSAMGTASQLGENIVIASSGDNIWFEKDDFTYLYRNVSFKKQNSLTVELDIDLFENSLCGGYIGIVIRENNEATSKNVTLRVSDSGNICLAVRKLEGSMTEAISGIDQHGKVTLKLVKVKNKFMAFTKKEDKWILLSETTVTFNSDSIFAGIGLFSSNPNFSIEVRVNKITIY